MLIGCGKDGERFNCMTKDQIQALCIADGIKLRKESWAMDSVQIDCERYYVMAQCYQKKDNYFPYER